MKNITITGARIHNLKGIDVSIPQNKLIVATGVSGSGKSSLVFDIIFEEGRRQYLRSLGMFTGIADENKFDNISGIEGGQVVYQGDLAGLLKCDESITIRHLLTMTAPFAWKTRAGSRGYEPLDRLRRQRDWVKYILNLMGRNGQPGSFQYNSLGPHLLSAIITRAAGMCAREFANERLFRPIGIREIPDHEMKSFDKDNVFGKNVTGWIKDPQGVTVGGWGLTITPRDMARFGFLYLNRGIWDNARIISETWIDESTAPNSNGYGYNWRLRGPAGRATAGRFLRNALFPL